MSRCGQQDHAAVTEQVVSGLEWRQAWISERFRVNSGPAQPVELDVVVQEPAQRGKRTFDGGPFLVADQDPGVAEFRQPADVVVVQVGQNDGVHVADVMVERGELPGQRLVGNRLSRS